jgi:hypothetical protein
MEDRVRWRAILALIPPATLVGALLLFDPMAQPLAYHDFADRRPWVGIPNFADVASNVAFLVPGAYWASASASHATPPGPVTPERSSSPG